MSVQLLYAECLRAFRWITVTTSVLQYEASLVFVTSARNLVDEM